MPNADKADKGEGAGKNNVFLQTFIYVRSYTRPWNIPVTSCNNLS